MQSSSEGCTNIAELANQLRREKIFINSERQLLQNLNEEVEKASLELLQVAWVCSQQRQNLTNLITSRCEADSIAACQMASLLDSTTFVDAHKVFKFKEANALGELLGWLRDSPHLVAVCLLLGEEHMPPSLPASLVAGLYGSCRSSADRMKLLTVIRSLIKHQLVPSPDPRKLFRTSKCALSQLFAVFRDGHSIARQFLIATLSGPVMSVLHEDEFFLDIEPDKAMERFSPSDRQKKFGQVNSPEYMAKVSRYRKWTVQSLYNLTSQFIASLREHWGSFPSGIAWIVQQIVHLLKQHSRTPEREIHALCTDIVFNNFICPAIVNPEAHCVVELPVSYIARSNLIQIAQILQVLALANYQEIDPKVRDLYSKFDRNCVSALLTSVTSSKFNIPDSTPLAEHSALRTEPHSLTTVALFTQTDLNTFVQFLSRVSRKLNSDSASSASEDGGNAAAIADAKTYSSAGSEVSWSGSEGGAAPALLHSLEPHCRERLHALLAALPAPPAPPAPPDHTPSPQAQEKDAEASSKKSILSKVTKPRVPRSHSSSSALSAAGGEAREGREGEGREDRPPEPPVVLLIALADKEGQDCVGLVPESKVLERYYGDAEGEAAAALQPPAPPVHKRTRFSVSHDEVSLGNTSDNLEAVSEAASNHSVTSSLELETEDQNDNLSDMVSANVSGRGSPNISGRETPSSQVTDGEPPAGAAQLPQRPNVANVNQASNGQKLLKQTRNDIEDKFCKFEIKKLLEGDETVSIMSDTWSTDVLASDSETIGDGDHTQIPAGQGTNTSNVIAPDVSETASESAWSMDVLASDSDRNTEVDTDDCVSVAARSDTSWPRRPSQLEEPLPQTPKRPDLNSPRHASKATVNNRGGGGGGYLTATAQLSRGAELDLSAAPPPDARKSILVNGYPVMTCYATSAPESPSTSAPPALPNHVFDYEPANNYEATETDSTLEGGGNSDATSQWVDDSFPQAHTHAHARTHARASANEERYNLPSTSQRYQDDMDRSLNSSESSFNALSVSQYDRRFEGGIDNEPQDSESRSTITDLMTRMSSATISTSANLVNNITARIVKSEIRTSIVSISSSRIEKRRENGSSLSVNSLETSVSDKSSSQDVNSDIVTERRVSPPPAKPSTGAIPKSISFDASAEKAQRRRIVGEDGLVSNLDDLKNNMKKSGGNLLNKIKMFRQKGRANHQPNGHEIKLNEEEQPIEEGSMIRVENTESSEEILAKYRRKSSADSNKGRRNTRRADAAQELDLERCEGVVDLNDPEVFNSMKKKLRMVLSNPDLHCVEYVPNAAGSSSLCEWVRAAGAAAAGAAAARAGGLARALAAGGAHAARLAHALRSDLRARRPYAAYLASCRADLAHSRALLHRQIRQVVSESGDSRGAAAAARVCDLLERRGALRLLHARSQRPLPHAADGELMDERASRLSATIKAITAEVKADPSWNGASPSVLEALETTVERCVFARLYLHVLFPNGDGDIARDQVISEHIRRLSACTSAASVGVGREHLWAAPFPRAQRELRRLCVARTPRDKVSCVMRCVCSIMSVLGLSEGAAPAADDLTPALVLVILRVNPPSLLSTIELVNALGGPALQGEALYWWTHFCAAVAYIKTMDYQS